MSSRFILRTRTDAPRDALFDASLSIDAHVASMSGSRERAIGGVTSGRIWLRESVTWRARHLGVWFTMTSQITALNRPHRFVDEQVRGPFRTFHHEHVFREDAGDTVMTDTLTIGSPVFGRVAERLVLVPYLRRLIRRRNAHLLASVGATARYASMTAPGAESWSATPAGFRRYERTTRVGAGEDTWTRASADLLRWGVKTRSGFEGRCRHADPPYAHPAVHDARVGGALPRAPGRAGGVAAALPVGTHALTPRKPSRSSARVGSSTRCRSIAHRDSLLPGRRRDLHMSNSADADEQRNEDAMPSDDELQEPSVAKEPGDEPKADKPLDPEPDHEAVGIGVIGGPQTDTEDTPAG